jgi:hypothetical protein
MCQASRGMGQRFTLYAFCHSYGLERAIDHVSDCCFCLTIITGESAKSKHTVQYPNLPFVMRPVPHSAELPVSKPPTNMMLSDSESSDEDDSQANNNMYCEPPFAGACSSSESCLLNQGNLNDIVRDLNL